jgi:DNA-binding response OmpR family regulator
MTNKPKILVVDDDTLISDLICTALSADKYAVDTAFDGDKGVRERKFRPKDSAGT